MIDLLIDTNVLIHLLHPTSGAEAGLTRQLLDWDRAGYIRIRVPAVSACEQGRSMDMLAAELDALGLATDRVLDVDNHADQAIVEINQVLGHRKPGDSYDALIVLTALTWAQQGQDTLFVTGDRNILRHAEQLQVLGVPSIVSLRGAVNRLKTNFPLTITRYGAA